MAKEKWYAVRKGKKPGIYRTWGECKAQVDHVSGAEYKSFKTKEEAEDYLNPPTVEDLLEGIEEKDIATAYVDGSFNIGDWIYGSGVYFLYRGKKIGIMCSGDDPSYARMRNVAGEIKAAMIAVQMAESAHAKCVEIFHDYTGISSWAEGAWAANLECTKAYKKFMQEHRKNIRIVFRKVAGHSGDEGNDIADSLARTASGVYSSVESNLNDKLDTIQTVYL